MSIHVMVTLCLANNLQVTDTTNFEATQMLHEWGLAHKQTRTLTSAGVAFYEIWQRRRNEAVDILHGLHYQLWSRLAPENNPASWAYKTVCDTLWQTQTIPKPKDFAETVALQLQMEGIAPSQANAAFSAKSIHDAYDWLLPLRPPVLLGVTRKQQGRAFKDAVFVRRAYCALPLFVMALSYLAREAGYQWGDAMPLDEEALLKICAACLIEPEVFPVLLDRAAECYPSLFHVNRSACAIAVLLPRSVRVEDFA
jgi:hypothetical protein